MGPRFINTNNLQLHDFHLDNPNNKDIKIAIFYINTNNGFTEFEDGNKILSEENKLVIFDNCFDSPQHELPTYLQIN